MSVRRLADDAVQPDSFAFTPDNDAWFEGELKKYPAGRQRSVIIPALMRAQEQEGWVTKRAIEHIADRLDMPYIRALEVATFYTQFMLAPVGTRAHVQVCGTTPCMLRGSEELFAICKSRIGERALTPNEDGTLSWEEVECQGACVNAPMVMIGKDAYEDLTPERFDEILTAFAEGKGGEVPTGPQNGRHLSAPLGGRTTLLDEDAIEEGAHDDAPLNGRADTGEEDNVAPSEAARPDTFSQRTSPAYAPEGAPIVDPAVERAASEDPDPAETGIGAPVRDRAETMGQDDEPSVGDRRDGVHPALDQKAAADPREAGEANERLAKAQIADHGTATGGTQKSVPVQSVHRDDERMPDGGKATADPSATTGGSHGPTGAGRAADVDQVEAQRNARDPIGADGIAAGDGAAADPKATSDDNTGENAAPNRQKPGGDVDASEATTAGGVAAPPQNFVADDPTLGSPADAGSGATVAKGGTRDETVDTGDGPEAEPERLSGPRGDGADDLKMIWGIGPKLETMLHEMGFYHFDQIASWGEAELNWVDRRLTGFRGRARRDKWVEQAERLAKGWRPDQGHGESPHG